MTKIKGTGIFVIAFCNGCCKSAGRSAVTAKKIGKEEPHGILKRHDVFRKRIAEYDKFFPNGYPPSVQKIVDKYEESFKFSRWTVDNELTGIDAVKATIDHEYGHIIADQYCGQINKYAFCGKYNEPATVAKRQLITDTYKKAKKTGDIYKLSEYGSTDQYEFFAETFSAIQQGESLPDYFIEMVLGVVR